MKSKTLLSGCEKGSVATVIKNNAAGALKQRLISFGLMRGSRIEILECSIAKKTIEIRVDKMVIALRNEEAELIEVEYE